MCKRGALNGFPLIMGILNVTPDSFSDGGRWDSVDKAVKHAFEMIDQGAAIIDVGAESTRPGSSRIATGEEISRLKPVLEALIPSSSVPISIDTMHAETAEACLELGADIINDVNGLREEGMMRVCAEHGASVVIGHMNGTIDETHGSAMGPDFKNDIKTFLHSRCKEAENAGIPHNKIIIDPGIGFGKDPRQNVAIVKDCSFLGKDYPIMIGLSRKRFVRELLPDLEIDTASALLSKKAVEHGASMVRTHNVQVTSEALGILLR